MTEITPPVNSVAQGVDDVLKGLISVGTLALETAIIAYLPFLGLPIIKQLMDAMIGWVTGQIYTAIALESNYLIYKFETAVEKSSYLQSIDDLKKAQGSGNDLLLNAAQKAFAVAAYKLIKCDGSAQT